MNLQEIKSALKAGKKVYWSNKAYEVIQSKFTQEYLVKCHLNDTYHGLTWRDGVTMNGEPKDLDEFHSLVNSRLFLFSFILKNYDFIEWPNECQKILCKA